MAEPSLERTDTKKSRPWFGQLLLLLAVFGCGYFIAWHRHNSPIKEHHAGLEDSNKLGNLIGGRILSVTSATNLAEDGFGGGGFWHFTLVAEDLTEETLLDKGFVKRSRDNGYKPEAPSVLDFGGILTYADTFFEKPNGPNDIGIILIPMENDLTYCVISMRDKTYRILEH